MTEPTNTGASNRDALEAQLDDATSLETNPVREWATDSEDRPYTPERVSGDWVQSTTMVRAYLEADRIDLVQEWIEELDENLQAFEDGEVPPGSDEFYSIYHDAVAREAIPDGQAPMSAGRVREQLHNVGMNVPRFDMYEISRSSGVPQLYRDDVARKLELPSGLQDVAAARLSVRRAIASITEDSESAQTHLQSANKALTDAVDTMRPEQTHANVTAAQESVRQASERVEAVADTAAEVDTEATVYTTPDCPGCFATKRALDKAGVEYDEIDLSTRPDLVQQFKRQNLAQSPIVETQDGDRWAGYNPSKMREHGLDHRSRQQRAGETGRDTGHGR